MWCKLLRKWENKSSHQVLCEIINQRPDKVLQIPILVSMLPVSVVLLPLPIPIRVSMLPVSVVLLKRDVGIAR